MSLYLDHLATLQQQAESALDRTGFDTLLIASGVEKYAFLDDRPYLFQANPHFKHWLPLTNHPHSWLAVRPGKKPRVVYFQPDDYWHVPPSAPSGEWVDAVELVVIREAGAVAQALTDLLTRRTAIVGEVDAALHGSPEIRPNNPEALLNLLHWARGVKTPYELTQMRAAQRRAVPAHVAAHRAFLAGASEADIHRAYLVASGHTDRDLPYGNIVGLNEHAAVLHYQHQDASPPPQSRSLLIDAGAEVNGYASDITRTWANTHVAGHDEFAALVAAMEVEQLGLVDEVREGVDYRDIHLSAHRRIARVLRGAGIVQMDEQAMVDEGVTKPFFPHGIGHLLGLQVHDVGGFMASADGGVSDKPDGHRYLRLTRPLQAGMVVTIEPGLYFIPMLLRELRASKHAGQVDWDAVERLSRYGGIRIEDDVACRGPGEAPENLTRDAFAAM
ncbi:MAG: Xaa-Pro dipeptidase [Rubrivivax sp.]|nr:MAG: Xaa-Pro dipeptidase [Rubrivivax sp.]